MRRILNYIGGDLVPPERGEFLDNVSPGTGRAYSLVANSTGEDVLRAVEAAREAFPGWSSLPAERRLGKLREIAGLIRSREAELARAEAVDNGKPVSLAAAVDVPRASRNFEYFAEAAGQFGTECHPMDGHAVNYTLRRPLGVVATISPWNLPLYLLTWKVAPALATGNTVVAKPSEVTPMTAFMLSEICVEAGLPPGVLNIVHGEGPRLGEGLVTHPEVRAVSFTGSTATGKLIARWAALGPKRVALEMGGKNPTIVFADCDLGAALRSARQAAFSNQGQICLCGSRIFVERPVYEEFKGRLVEQASRMVPGDPLSPDTRQGAVVSRAHQEKILRHLDLAREEGGTVLCGGGAFQGSGENAGGFFVRPTLIEGLGPGCRTNQEEIFGPVATLIPFDGEEEVVEWANSTPYGLAASVWTENHSRAHRLARDLQSGLVWINTWMLRDLRIPFGGMKDSGLGREGGADSLRFFTEPRNVCFRFDGRDP